MSTLQLTLPQSIQAQVEALAQKEGISITEFITLAVAEKLATLATADVLLDFDKSGNDVIDLSLVYGPKLAFIGAAAFTAVGQVRINDIAGADVVVQVNTGGSLAADMHIRVAASTFASMTATDFVL